MSAANTASRKSGAAGRRRALFVLAVTALLVVPAALSWACGPNRAIQLDRFDYKPNQTVTVTGANFEPGASVTITVNSEPTAHATASGSGNISASFPAPSSPGAYTVATFGVDQNGQALAGTGGTQSFTVSAPAPSTSGGGSGTPAPSTGNRAPAPSGTTGAQPGTTRQSGSNVTSGRERSRAGTRERSRSTTGRAFGPSRSGTTSGPGVNTAEGVISTDGITAFAGSVPRSERAAAATRARSEAASPSRANPTRSTATGDLWSGFASAKNPSLLPTTGSGVPAGETSSGTVIGLALLGLGALALLGIGGLAAAGRRKGRAPSA